MDETPRENWATYFGLVTTIIPALIASGFMPEFDVLPFAGWVALATTAAGIAGAIATPLWARGATAGGLAGAGMLMGIWLYVTLRADLTGNATFLKLELAIVTLLRGAPGVLLFANWPRAPREQVELPRAE